MHLQYQYEPVANSIQNEVIETLPVAEVTEMIKKLKKKFKDLKLKKS